MFTGYFPARPHRLALCAAFGAFLISDPLQAIVDRDNNQQSDIWELTFNAAGLSPTGDADFDGVTNLAESAAGTNPFDPRSRFVPGLVPASGGLLQARWLSFSGKRYQISSATTLGSGAIWSTTGAYNGTGSELVVDFANAGEPVKFLRVTVDDLDTDGDGLSDWEERALRLDPTRKNTEGIGSASVTDFTAVNSALGGINTINLVAISPDMAENWPDPGVIAVRRTGNLTAITVNLVLGGTATPGVDYQVPASLSVPMGLGVDEVWVEFRPLSDAEAESTETIEVYVQAGSGYTSGLQGFATLNLSDSPAGSISYKEAARFLMQATYGPTDAEIVRVQQLGFSGWLDEQFAQAPQYHLPLVQQWNAEMTAVDPNNIATSNERTEVWWRRAMQADAARDPLRQRVAHALSQIFVISDRNDTLANWPFAMAAYHDKVLENSFGNYRDMLRFVTLHPTMGIYLSHLRNRKADPARNIYPDENYAREIMQLFSIGLWELNPNGTRQIGGDGQPISTYDNNSIANLARVFTGLSYGSKYTSSTNFTIIPTTGFFDSNGISWEPMRGFDAYHDLASKTLLRGVTLPVRTASSGPDTGAATMLDVEAALDNLFTHPNTGPFIARLLIQRMVSSNPSDGYVGRVAAVFANNGSGVRGDFKAVVRAILLDSEARSYSFVTDIEHGVQREPYLRYVALVKALSGPTSDGRYRGFRNIDTEFQQRPYSAPSVFNFYLPEFQPLGALTDAGLFGPEFQITNSVTGITAPNRFYSGIIGNFNPSGQSDTTQNSKIDTAPWIDDATSNPDVLIARLDRILTSGTLSPQSLRNVSRAVRRLTDPLTQAVGTARTNAAIARLRMAIYLIAISPEACVQQ